MRPHRSSYPGVHRFDAQTWAIAYVPVTYYRRNDIRARRAHPCSRERQRSSTVVLAKTDVDIDTVFPKPPEYNPTCAHFSQTMMSGLLCPLPYRRACPTSLFPHCTHTRSATGTAPCADFQRCRTDAVSCLEKGSAGNNNMSKKAYFMWTDLV